MTIGCIEEILKDDYFGIEKPVAVILETVQAEGGGIPAPAEWLQRLTKCAKRDILFICDNIQVVCGRTGRFFYFERAGIIPDKVTLSKSNSGGGAVNVPAFDKARFGHLEYWRTYRPFRGNQLAIVGDIAALEYREKVIWIGT